MSDDTELIDEYLAEVRDRYEDNPEELAFDLELSIDELIDAFREQILEKRLL